MERQAGGYCGRWANTKCRVRMLLRAVGCLLSVEVYYVFRSNRQSKRVSEPTGEGNRGRERSSQVPGPRSQVPGPRFCSHQMVGRTKRAFVDASPECAAFVERGVSGEDGSGRASRLVGGRSIGAVLVSNGRSVRWNRIMHRLALKPSCSLPSAPRARVCLNQDQGRQSGTSGYD